MAWINTIPYEEADARLKKIYDRIKGPNNNVDNVLLIHSLRPHTLTGHMTLYKSVLHHSGNTLPKWYLEALGVYVSYLNKCNYCVDHHFAGLRRLWNDEQKSSQFWSAIQADNFIDFFAEKELQGMAYARQITLDHTSITKERIEALKEAGFSEGEVLEINQVCSYFNYVNRSVVGLGVNTEGDILGLSPNENDDPENWSHT